MALTVAQIISVAAPAVMRDLRKHYFLGTVNEATNFFVTSLYDSRSTAAVNVAWTRNDEIKLKTEKDRINFCTSLLRNAVNALDHVLYRSALQDDDVVDVVFGDLDE